VNRESQLRVKRAVDIVGAGVGLVAGAPLILGVAAAVRVFLGSPVLFKQVRPGLHGKPFTLLKFRTMRDAHDRSGKPLPDAERLTRFGRALRATSLDELPQLVNVLRGEMSLVGPRPLLVEYLSRYSPREARRHEMPPGITGWTQVRGRNSLSWAEKHEGDVQYIEQWSLALDARLLLETVLAVVKRDGVSAAGHVTMPEFMGTLAKGGPAGGAQGAGEEHAGGQSGQRAESAQDAGAMVEAAAVAGAMAAGAAAR
jgi:lipopolysaccharide/colanic/teichoic acid biosynthesis glycosyltransferase